MYQLYMYTYKQAYIYIYVLHIYVLYTFMYYTQKSLDAEEHVIAPSKEVYDDVTYVYDDVT